MLSAFCVKVIHRSTTKIVVVFAEFRINSPPHLRIPPALADSRVTEVVTRRSPHSCQPAMAAFLTTGISTLARRLSRIPPV